MQEVAVIRAVDWGITVEETSSRGEFGVVHAVLVGFIVSEDDEQIVIAPQWFDSGSVRCVLAVPKCTIESISKFTPEEIDKA